MTDRHNIIFQLMLAGMMVGIASVLVDKHSLYDHLKIQYMQEVLREELPHAATLPKEGDTTDGT